MSQIEQSKWQGLVDGLASDLNALRKVENVKPTLDFHPEQVAVEPGSDLGYLTPIIREQIAAHPLLAQARIHHTAERLVISLPADVLFGAGTAVPAPRAMELGSALVSVLRHLNNSIEVEAQLERADWELALARAAAFSGILTDTGYTSRIVARATAPTGSPRSQGARLDIVIHKSAREPQ
jgi:flagellar motor protein MotB